MVNGKYDQMLGIYKKSLKYEYKVVEWCT
jgi:hypothetical protein